MFDGIIVGAGPAGSTAAYHHAKQGRSVLVLEKASLLRNKPWGGRVSGAIAHWLDFDLTPAISLKANKISYTWKMQEVLQKSKALSLKILFGKKLKLTQNRFPAAIWLLLTVPAGR